MLFDISDSSADVSGLPGYIKSGVEKKKMAQPRGKVAVKTPVSL